MMLKTFLTAVAVMAAHATELSQKYQYSKLLDSGTNYTLHWTHDVTGQQTKFAISAKTSGWVALGISRSSGMSGADIWLGWAYDGTGNTGQVYDYYADGWGVPTLDAQQDVSPIAFAQSSTSSDQDVMTTVEFGRKWDTGNAMGTQDNGIDPSGENQFIWAIGAQDPASSQLSSGDYHSARGSLALNLCPDGDCTLLPTTSSGGNDRRTPTPTSNPPYPQTQQQLGGDSMSAEFSASDYPASYTPSSTLSYHWKIIKGTSASPIIEVAMRLQGTGWIAIGFQPQGRMAGADIILGFVSNGAVTVQDMKASGEVTPQLDPVQNILQSAGSESNGVTVIKFQRLLNTGDSNDAVLKVEQKNTFIWAYHPSNDALVEHPRTGRGSFSAVLSASNQPSETKALNDEGELSKLIAHGALMLVAWIVLVPLGIIMAKFWKRLGHKWYLAHAGIQSFACLLTLASFILIIVIKSPDGHAFFDASTNPVAFTHAIFGVLVTVIGAVFQPVIGKIADSMWKADRTEVPVWPDKVHWYTGRVVSLLALINIILGVIVLDDQEAVWFGVLIVLVLAVAGAWVWSWRAFVKSGGKQAESEGHLLQDVSVEDLTAGRMTEMEGKGGGESEGSSKFKRRPGSPSRQGDE